MRRVQLASPNPFQHPSVSCWDRYRFGFNGQEKDDEVAGAGNTNTAMYWEYDTRLGRRWNLDPKPTIGISDYAVMGDNPIFNMDWLGDIWRHESDKKVCDNTKAEVQAKIDEIDKKMDDLDKKVNVHQSVYDPLVNQKWLLTKVIRSLDAMEKDQETAYTFAPHEGSLKDDKKGNTMTQDGLENGILSYEINDKGETNYENKNYNTLITLNYRVFPMSGDDFLDGQNKTANIGLKIHEVIHGGQYANKLLKLPNKERRDNFKFDAVKGFKPEEDAVKSQDAYTD
jgi:hypothetical protein